MRSIGLFVMPGSGYRTVNVDDNMTVTDLLARENLSNRTPSVAGRELSASEASTTRLAGIDIVFATGSVKGA